MNLDELMDALSGTDPDPEHVIVSLGRKQRQRRQRQQRLLAVTGSACATVLVVLGGLYLSVHVTGNTASSSSAAAAAGAPTAAGASGSLGKMVPGALPRTSVVPGPKQGFASGAGAQGSCAGVSLKDSIASAVRSGASVIVATGRLTGKSVTASPAAGTAAYYAMTLSSVQVLRGPAIAPGSVAWVPGPAPGSAASPENSALLATGGRVFAIVARQSASPGAPGPTLHLAPVVGGDVVFTPYGCWDVSGLRPSQYQGKAALRAVPDGPDVNAVNRPAESGLYAVPLATVEQVAAQA